MAYQHYGMIEESEECLAQKRRVQLDKKLRNILEVAQWQIYGTRDIQTMFYVQLPPHLQCLSRWSSISQCRHFDARSQSSERASKIHAVQYEERVISIALESSISQPLNHLHFHNHISYPPYFNPTHP